MKLEEILPHLRTGGRVKYNKYNIKLHYNLEEIFTLFTLNELLSNDFEIVKRKQKMTKEHDK